ncbi:IclR family transcriptional regulator [Hoeflea sp.]|uniref:IclR family transcriptional regulator n=1 Tax=Hoeflea sp. TaxID=1940281 RepID=UPI003A94BF88
MSSTVAKALTLLDHFTENDPEIGLSDLARRSRLDKATVHRMLSAMADAGLVEQRHDTKLYRLGAGILRLARIREEAFPFTSVLQPELNQVARETGETAHASLISGRALATVGICDSSKANRVSLVAGEILPFHTTASGLATLAFGPEALSRRVLAGSLDGKTSFTLTDPEKLNARIETARQTGFGETDQTNEIDVYGIAAPFFDKTGLACGAIAVATPSHRMSEELRSQIIGAVFRAAEAVTKGTGGKLPGRYQEIVRTTLSSLTGAQD